jgi:hypothetical protein
MVTDRSLQVVRGLTVAAAGVGLPIAGHLVAGGSATLSATTVVTLVLVATITVAASGREWTLSRIVATLLPVQALVHVSMASGTSHATAHGSSTAVASAVDGAMVVGHLVALVAVALWLRLAERALLALLALIERLAVRPTTWLPPALAAHRTAFAVSLRAFLWTPTVQARAPPLTSSV